MTLYCVFNNISYCKKSNLVTCHNRGFQINNIIITDESSAIEYAQLPSFLVPGSSDNIKITRPDDLALAAFLLDIQQEKLCE